MIFPNVSAALSGWGRQTKLKRLAKKVVDHEVVETPTDVAEFLAVLEPLTDRKLAIKPEGERKWKWWTMWAQVDLELDSLVQDSDGKVFRVDSSKDWRQGGYLEYDLVEWPNKAE